MLNQRKKRDLFSDWCWAYEKNAQARDFYLQVMLRKKGFESFVKFREFSEIKR